MRAEMIEVAGEIGARWTKRLLNPCVRQCKVPEDWRIGLIIPIWKGKGDAQDPGKYRGITLLSHIMKLLERILNKRLREKVEHKLGEDQKKGGFHYQSRGKGSLCFFGKLIMSRTQSSLDLVAYYVFSHHLHTSPGNNHVLKKFSVISPNASTPSCTIYC